MGYKAWCNACDYDDCYTCPHEDCISNEKLYEKRHIKRLEDNKKYQKKKYYRNKSMGLCVRCGKKSCENSIYCLEHRDYHRKVLSKYQKKNYIIKNRNPIFCYRCRKNLKKDGFELCEECLKKASLSCMKARIKRFQNKFIKYYILLDLLKNNQ